MKTEEGDELGCDSGIDARERTMLDGGKRVNRTKEKRGERRERNGRSRERRKGRRRRRKKKGNEGM